MRVKTIEKTGEYFDDCVNRWLYDNEGKVNIKEIKIDSIYVKHKGDIKYVAIILYEDLKELRKELNFGLYKE